MLISDEKIIEVLKACPQEDHTQEGWIWKQRIAWSRAIEAAVLEEPAKQKPVAWCFVQNGFTHYTDDKRDWYDAVGVEEVTPLYAAPVVQPGYKLLKDTTHDERSWPEDSSHENGAYFCMCHHCGRQFTGYKRRVTCKVCAAVIAAAEGKK